jgi:hypothetical protein
MKMTVFWTIALVTEAAHASEASVNFYQTNRRSIPEDPYLLRER